MNIQSELKSALNYYIESGKLTALDQMINSFPEIISTDYGEYPDVHRLMDLRVAGKNFRICRQISQEEKIMLIPIEELCDTPGVPLWLTGKKLAIWAEDERENPSDEPTDWARYC